MQSIEKLSVLDRKNIYINSLFTIILQQILHDYMNTQGHNAFGHVTISTMSSDATLNSTNVYTLTSYRFRLILIPLSEVPLGDPSKHPHSVESNRKDPIIRKSGRTPTHPTRNQLIAPSVEI